MEPIYDFTPNKLFSRKDISADILPFFTMRFPWEKIYMKEVFSDKDLKTNDELFFCGTSKQIKSRYSYKKVETGEMCERCGKKIERMPWDFKRGIGLCDSCFDYLERLYGTDMFGMPIPKRQEEYPWWLLIK